VTAHEALIGRLVTQGIGVLGSTLFASIASELPGGPGPYTSLLATSGLTPVGTHNAGPTKYRRPTFQVVARAQDPKVARSKAVAAYAALTVTNQTIGSLWFLSVTPQQEPFELPADPQGRARWAFNVATEHAT
jgi:hypothetical protein